MFLSGIRFHDYIFKIMKKNSLELMNNKNKEMILLTTEGLESCKNCNMCYSCHAKCEYKDK